MNQIHPTDLYLPRIAVCLAAFNGVRYLQEQINSVFAQTSVAITLFVSVDRSSDGTEEWFRNLQTRNGNVVLLPCGEVFGGAAPNFFRLIREVNFSPFDYVAYADQDDVWVPQKLHRAVTTMLEQGADGYSSDVVAFWESGKTRYIKKSYSQQRWDFLFESAGPGCTFVVSRQLAIDMQCLLQQHLQKTLCVGLHDWFTYAFARAHGYKWVIDTYGGLMYRQHGDNQVGVNAGARALVWRAKKVLNGWGLNQARLIAELVGVDSQEFVQGWLFGGRWAMLKLALQSADCRRKRGDQVWFALSCAALALIGWK